MEKLISKLLGGSRSTGELGGAVGAEYINLEKHLRRLLEIEQTLGEIGDIFSSESGQTISTAKADDPLHKISEMVNRLRVPGFFAYHLAQEGLVLLNVIAASAAFTKKNVGESSKINTIVSHIDEAEEMFRQAIHEMEPYRSMDAKEAIETIVARMAEQKTK
jgi:hypothetical protein